MLWKPTNICMKISLSKYSRETIRQLRPYCILICASIWQRLTYSCSCIDVSNDCLKGCCLFSLLLIMKCYFFTKLSRIRHDGSEFRLVMILTMQGVFCCRSQSNPSLRSCDVTIGGSTTTTCTVYDKSN